MDIKVYTDAVENHVLQVLSFLQKETRYMSDIYCKVTCYPNNSTGGMTVEIHLSGLLPINGVPSKDWADRMHKELRKFPCMHGLTIKYNHPRASWTEDLYTQYGYTNNMWEHLEHACGGLTAYIEANIPQPALASDHVVVKLEWNFHAPDGYQEQD